MKPTAGPDSVTRGDSDRGSVPTVRVRNLSKVFPATVALNDVSLDILPGEVHGLVGGNGSGKSTLIKILAGVYQGEPGGTIEVGDTTIDAARISPETAHRLGIRVVHQDLGVFPDLTLAENLSLGHGFDTGFGGRVRWSRIRARTWELIERFEIPGTPRTLVRDLSRAGRTQVAIARALQDQEEDSSGLLILDEPTTALPAHEVELLLASLKRYASAGQSILYVSHRLQEMLDLTDRVTVLRDSRVQDTFRTTAIDEVDLIRAIIGADVDLAAVHETTVRPGNDVLTVRGMSAGPVNDASFSVKAGEIVGVAGLLGSGRTELLRAIFADMPIDAGTIELDGVAVRWRHPTDAMRAGVAFVPEDRIEESTFLDQPVYANIAIGDLSTYWRGLRLRDRRMRSDGVSLMAQFTVKSASERALMTTLSGGNQQKVVLARWMRRRPQLLLLDEPTQGVDVGARSEIYALVRKAVEDGMAVIVVASDFEELLLLADRIIVLKEGRLVGDIPRDRLTLDSLTQITHSGRMA